MYCPGSIKYTCQATWHSETHVNPPCQPWHKSTNVTPLTVKLLTDKLSLIVILFEYIAFSLSHGRYSIIYKVYIIYKPYIIY